LRENNVTLGIATTAIGLSYLSNSYVPIEQNTFLYASAPVRVIHAAISGARLAMEHYMQRRRNGDGPKARLRKKLWGMVDWVEYSLGGGWEHFREGSRHIRREFFIMINAVFILCYLDDRWPFERSTAY